MEPNQTSNPERVIDILPRPPSPAKATGSGGGSANAEVASSHSIEMTGGVSGGVETKTATAASDTASVSIAPSTVPDAMKLPPATVAGAMTAPKSSPSTGGLGGMASPTHDVHAARGIVEGANDVVSSTNLQTGLTARAVEEVRAKSGYNEVITPQDSLWLLAARKFWGLSPWMLEVVIIVSGALGKWVDLGVVAFLLFFNASLAFHEDIKARKAVDALKQKLQVSAKVLRDSEWTVIPARELVPGDVIRVRSGDWVPSDARVVHGACGVDQSALTGESVVLDRPSGSILFSASLVRRGEVTCVVTAIGASTFFGKTAKLVDESNPTSHIDKVVTSVTKGLMTIVILSAILAIIVLLATKSASDVVDSISLLLVLIVSVIPVALPAMYTTAMALGSHELVSRGVIVTRLGASEDAASMTVLCSDKTGTITTNEMSVQEVVMVPNARGAKSDTELLAYGVLASKLSNQDPIDIAIFDAVNKGKFKASSIRASPRGAAETGAAPAIDAWVPPTEYSYKELHFTPFDAATRRTEALLEVTDLKTGAVIGTRRIMKGALATLTGLAPQTSAADVEQLNIVAERHGLSGWRSIAVAVTDIVPIAAVEGVSPTAASAPVHVLGVIGMADSARVDSKATIATLNQMGIKVMMLTGDNTRVARAVALEVGLPPNIINLEAEKHRIRQLLESGHHSIPRRPGQTLPSAMIQHSPDLQPVNEANAQHYPLRVIAPSPVERKAAHDHRQPAIRVANASGAERDSHTNTSTTASLAAQAEGGVAHAKAPFVVTDETVMEEMRHGLDIVRADGFAQIFPADKHMIVKGLQATGAIVGMTGDGVNDAPALKQAEVGCAVSNATDVAKGSASAVLTHDGLSGIVELVRVGRQIHHRIETWILSKTTRSVSTVGFIIVAFLITGQFPITAFSLLLMVFLFDFVTITIATDTVTKVEQPCKWLVYAYMQVGSVLGVCVCLEMFGMYYFGSRVFDLTADELTTLSFELIMFSSLMNVMCVRERKHFYDSVPGRTMWTTISIELVVILIISSLGLPGLTPVDWRVNLLCFAYIFISIYVVNDFVKAWTFAHVVTNGAAKNPNVRPSHGASAVAKATAGAGTKVVPVNSTAPEKVEIKTEKP